MTTLEILACIFLFIVANSNNFYFPNSTLEYFLSLDLPLSKLLLLFSCI